MGSLVSFLPEGARLGSYTIPPEHIRVCTVCSVTLNGVFLKYGIPIRSLFSSLLQLERDQTRRFVKLISYDGTSIDPLQLFIQGKMTDYLGAIQDGNGKIGAFLKIGRPSRDLLNVPVYEGCCGLIVIGDLNPVAVFEEL